MTDHQAEQERIFLYLVRHGEAKPKKQDPERPLTDVGTETVKRVAAWAAAAGLTVNQVRHSGKLRARQTAAIFAQQLQPSEGMTQHAGLGPHDDVKPLAKSLADPPCSVMIVGHLPFLSRLAGVLVADNPNLEVIRFRQGAVVGLMRADNHWQIICVVPPELFPTGA